MRRAVHTAWRRLGDETVVVDLRDRRIVGLDPVGGWIWSLLDGRALGEVEAAVADLPDAGTSSAAEVRAFVAELGRRGLAELGLAAGAGPQVEQPARYQPPTVVWDEPLEQAAASCGFISGQTPLCTQVPAI